MLLLDIIIGIAISSSILMLVLTNFNSMISWQKKQQIGIEHTSAKVSIDQLLRKDFSLAFDPTEELKKIDKMKDQNSDKSRRKNGSNKESDQNDKNENSNKNDTLKDDKDKIPRPFTIVFHEENVTSKIFKTKINLTKKVSFVSTNSICSTQFQPCRITYYLDQFQGKTDAKESLYKLYRLETKNNLKYRPTSKEIKANGTVFLDNVIEFSIQGFFAKDLSAKLEKSDKLKNTKSLKEALDNDFKVLKEENETLEKEQDKKKGKDLDGNKAKSLVSEDFPRIYLIKIAYKENGIIQKIEIQVSSLTAKSLQTEKPRDSNKKNITTDPEEVKKQINLPTTLDKPPKNEAENEKK